MMNDISLLKLDKRLEKNTMAALPMELNYGMGTPVMVAGWGATSAFSPYDYPRYLM